MANGKLSMIVILVFATLERGVAEIVTKPAATEVVVGGATYLNCSTNSPHEIQWFHTPFVSNQDRNFVYGYDQFYGIYIGRYQMERNAVNGAYNLVIPSVKIEDAGIYECQDETGRGAKESAQLIVLDTDPVCEPHMDTLEIIAPNKCGIEQSRLIISCIAEFKGNEAPILEWRSSSDNIPVSDEVTHAIIDNNRVMYNLTINGNSTVKNGDYYFCNTTRSTALNKGCRSGMVKIAGANAGCPECLASEICQPYIKPYIDAIICIFLIILPAAIAGTLVVFWYLKIYRRKDNVTHTQEAATTEEMSQLNNSPSSGGRLRHPSPTCTQEAATTEEMSPLNNSPSSETNDRQSNEINDLKTEIEQLRNKNIDTNEKLRKLECEAADKIRQKSDEIERLQQINKVSDNEITQLKARVSDLERSLYPAGNIDYAEKPTLVHTIVTYAAENKEGKEIRKPINGMTILCKELFVSFEKNSKIEVYDAETFQFVIDWEILKVSHPMDMASCTTSNCIYVIHQEDKASESQIVKLEPKGKLINEWSIGGNNGRLSTYKSNVIVCLFEKQLINEYSGDGNLVHTVRLSPAVGFNHPLHAIKVTRSHLAVCHGDVTDKLHRVCIVDAEGNIIKELRKLDVPVCLVEDSERSILVIDRDKKKIKILNCFLKKQRSLIKKENGLVGHPIRICLDETKGRLYVAENTLRSGKKEWKEWKDGKILIYNIK